jgi:N-acetyl-gamma-glutamyl-phosphate reductase
VTAADTKAKDLTSSGNTAVRPAVFVDGASGTTGLEIRQRLDRQDDVTVKSLDGDKRRIRPPSAR